MEWFMNPFVVIVEKDKTFFFGKDSQSIDLKNGMVYPEHERKIFDKLIKGEKVEDSDFAKWDQKHFEFLKNNNYVVPRKIDTKGVCSRVFPYLQKEGIKNLHEFINKKVLILGCGGIGTHVAWNLVATGITNIILLDFDVVEFSNLNRQILYTVNDIGRKKTETLKERLLGVNPAANISIIDVKIESEEQLKSIIESCDIDLIIKSIDSPEAFPVWLDKICRELEKKYVSGTLSDTFGVIGPSLTLTSDSYGYSEILPDRKFKHIHGIAPSLACQTAYTASCVSAEGIKILAENEVNCMYKDKIGFEDIISNKSMDMYHRDIRKDINIYRSYMINKNLLMAMICIASLMALQGYDYMGFLLGILIPLSSIAVFKAPENSAKGCFVNTLLYYAFCTVMFIAKNVKILLGYSVVQILSLVMMLFVGYSFVMIMFVAIAYILTALKGRISMKDKA